ncbi:E3 ubiquitin-protein ligase rnf146 isoform X2 [Drosophila biarmipes]|uniref:E3 ubiquitin-protein ligase rnf146 isoform X2 n=1 Tax=Drosophila biarmipes TaxID=125945 RepID=UPI0007E63C8F|nr:E3 ubiquitin-protein ligase rnf146 isoform X2 [Drosophila biarmipes]
MSQQRASEQGAASSNNNGDVITLDDDDEDEDVQFVGIVRPSTTIIDLCLSPSTSAAAAAARSGNGSADDPATGSGSVAAAATSAPNSPGSLAGEAAKATDEDAATSTSSGDSPATSAAALECPICLQTCIHPARLPCGHIFCFLCVKGVAYKNRRCAMCRREIPAEFLDHPQLVNGIEDICTTRATEDGYQWYYEGRNGGWWAYDSRTNGDIELAYADYEKSKNGKPENPNAANVTEIKAITNPIVNADRLSVSDSDTILHPSPDRVPVLQAPETRPAPEAASSSIVTQRSVDFDDSSTEEDDSMSHDLNINTPRAVHFETDSDDSLDSSDYGSEDEEMNSEGWLSSDSGDLNDTEPHPGRLLIQICGVMYAIDFVQMKQYPRTSPEKRRSIQRCTTKDALPVRTKGVAGLSSTKNTNKL